MSAAVKASDVKDPVGACRARTNDRCCGERVRARRNTNARCAAPLYGDPRTIDRDV